MQPQNPASNDHVPAQLLTLGMGGLMPFFALTLAAWVAAPDNAALATRYLVYYAAVILSFVGALHWGFAMVRPIDEFERGRIYGWSVCPALAAWFALMLPTAGGLVTIVVMLAHPWCRRHPARRAPPCALDRDDDRQAANRDEPQRHQGTKNTICRRISSCLGAFVVNSRR
jgi:hypothetical protein